MDKLASALYEGHVMHHRFRPATHRFIYRVFSCLIDLDELERLNKLRFFSVNRFNLFSFHEKDHGSGERGLRTRITQLLSKRGFESATDSIRVLCYPRILGYTFNPLSVYFCYNRQQELEVVLYEVNNTFGSRHTYLVKAEQGATVLRQQCNKLMYVSPFMPMDTAYGFRIVPPTKQVAVCIRQTEVDSETEQRHPILHATFTGTHQTLNDKQLIKAFTKYPLMTLKVITAIHWEALKLWRKKLVIQPRDKEISQSISWQDDHGEFHYESL